MAQTSWFEVCGFCRFDRAKRGPWLAQTFPFRSTRLFLSQVQALEMIKLQAALARSRTAYRDFLTLWKNADPDIPILKQAKAEYARLQ
ncbi:MAG: hypothetical protein ACRD3T_12700 [Terriglobia bacterium]